MQARLHCRGRQGRQVHLLPAGHRRGLEGPLQVYGLRPGLRGARAAGGQVSGAEGEILPL